MTSLRYALRSLKKSPGFVTIAVLALGVGLGMSTTMFAVMDAVLNPHVAYREPQELFTINWWFGRRQPMNQRELYTYLRDNTRSFQGIVSIETFEATLEINGSREPTYARRVGWRYFDITGFRAMRGRVLSSSDNDDVAMVSEDMWKRLFGNRRDIAGATMLMNGRSVGIVGVLPKGSGNGSVWVPLPANAPLAGGERVWGRPLVRLRSGVSREDADREIKALARTLTERFGARDAPFSFELYPVVENREEIRDIHKAMVGSALAVLLIACVNLAHLMMARSLAKRRELALRMALGASRAIVVRQLFLECAIVTVAGALLGALLTIWGADILRNRIPREVSWIGFVQPQLSWRVFAAAAMAAALSAVLFGLLPALRVVMNVNLDDPLKDDSGTTTGRVRYRYNPLVVAEVGLALVLMMGGGLLLRTVYQLRSDPITGDLRNVYSGWIQGPERQRGGAPRDTTLRGPTREALLTAALSTPGVVNAAVLASRGTEGMAVTAEMSGDSNRTIPLRFLPAVSPTYFTVLGLPVLKGRGIEPGDEFGNGVVVIDALAASLLYPNQEAVGRMLKLGGPMTNAPWVRIVGIVRSPRVLEEDMGRYSQQARVYASITGDARPGQMVIRTSGADPGVAAKLSVKMRELSGVSGAFFYPYNFQRQSEITSRGFLAKVFVGMGAVALALAGLGLYGVLAYSVGRRMREFAVRLALGCEPKALRRMVLHDGFVMLLAGIGVGAFFALAASRWLDSVLIAVLPSDVISLVACELLLFTVGLAAALAPARRAAKANPLEILRAS